MTTLPPLRELLYWPPGQAPYAKQEEAHQASSAKRLFALFMEQRCGKLVVSLGTAVHHYLRFLEAGGFGGTIANGGAGLPQPLGVPSTNAIVPPELLDLLPRKFVSGSRGKREGTRLARRIDDLPVKPSNPGMIYRPAAWAGKGVDAIFVAAMPSGVPHNWAAELMVRIPANLNPLAFVWSTDRAGTAAFADEFLRALFHPGLVLFAINGEALTSSAAKKAIGTFLRCRRALTIGDETSLLCAGAAGKRALVLEAIKNLPGAVARRILDGTPGDESPLDYYAQVRFLSKKIFGFETYGAFKEHYAVWADKDVWVAGKLRTFKAIAVDEITGEKKWKNLDDLGTRLAPWSFRVKRTDCFDVPAKVYAPHRFELSVAQRAVYDPLREEFEAWLDAETKVKAAHVLSRLIRCDQVASNFWPPETIPTICGACQGDGCDACGDVGAIMGKTAKRIIDPARNPRIEALGEVFRLNPEPGIVWTVFNETSENAVKAAILTGRSYVRYDGTVGDDEKVANLNLFKTGKAEILISKEASAGRGLDGRAAMWHCYVENGYSKRKRSQSEDRAEVAGRVGGTGIIDLIAVDTYDDEKLKAHRSKAATSERIELAIARARAEMRSAA